MTSKKNLSEKIPNAKTSIKNDCVGFFWNALSEMKNNPAPKANRTRVVIVLIDWLRFSKGRSEFHTYDCEPSANEMTPISTMAASKNPIPMVLA